MGDSTPLLSESGSDHSASFPILLPHAAPAPSATTTFDDAFEQCIGGDLSKFQLYQAILVSFAWFFDAQQTFISVFTDAVPNWHAITTTTTTTVCHLPEGSWAWDGPINSSIISEWALQCSGPIISGLPSSSFFMGCVVGGLVLSTLADSSLGRKNTLILSCFIMSLFSSLLTLFSTNVWTYSAFKFAIGFGRASIGSCALVLSTETIGKRWRGRVGIVGFLCFTIGFLSLPAIAYLNRTSSWRIIYLWTSIPTILYSILIHFVVCESPRWLFVRGRKEEAVATLKTITNRKTNNNSSQISSFFDLPDNDVKHEEGEEVKKEKSKNDDVYLALKVLVRKGWAVRRLLAVMMVALGIGVVYYAMPLAVGELAFENLYVSVAFNALSEVPSSVLTWVLIERMRRKDGVVWSCVISACSSIACGLMMVVMGGAATTARWWRWMAVAVQVGLELISFSGACTAFGLLLIYTVELFPTSVRNSALAAVRQALVAGGVVGPVVVAAGRESGNGLVSFGVFGVVIGCGGMFALLLPETLGRTLYDTLEEEEYYTKDVAPPVADVAVVA